MKTELTLTECIERTVLDGQLALIVPRTVFNGDTPQEILDRRGIDGSRVSETDGCVTIKFRNENSRWRCLDDLKRLAEKHE